MNPTVSSPPAVTPPGDRAQARAVAEWANGEIAAVNAAGGNPYQRANEVSDSVGALVEGWSDEDGAAFLYLYAEEMEALTAHTQDQTTALLQTIERDGQIAETVGGIIGAALLIGVLFYIFSVAAG